MDFWKQFKALVAKDLKLEQRDGYAFASQLLYIAGAVFICYLSVKLKGGSLNVGTWIALFWLVNLFSAISAIARSFQQESKNRHWYYYSLCNPQALVLSKMLFNVLQLWMLALLSLVGFYLMLGAKIEDLSSFGITVLLGNLCFATCLTMVSAIVSVSQGNATLMAVLSFPIVVPALLINNKLSKLAVDGIDVSLAFEYWGMLSALSAASLVLSLLLFPYLWRSQSH